MASSVCVGVEAAASTEDVGSDRAWPDIPARPSALESPSSTASDLMSAHLSRPPRGHGRLFQA
eukprot:7983662-Alexandrium_andersonii.AAC.1